VFLDLQGADEDSTRPEYGEARRKIIGAVRGLLITVVYTTRGDLRRIISARRVRPDERGKYDQGTSLP
jgi:uncharacterized DUF497 family protein